LRADISRGSRFRPSADRAAEINKGTLKSIMGGIEILQWFTVMVGLAGAVSEAATGNVNVVVALAVAIFITSWRAIAPIELGVPGTTPLAKALIDVTALAGAIGYDGGMSSPFIGSLFVAIAVASFGWGLPLGLGAVAIVAVVSPLASLLTAQPFAFPGPVSITALIGVAVIPAMALDRLTEMERRRRLLLDQRDHLGEANKLLEMLNELTRTLPSSLDMNEVIEAARSQMIEVFGAYRLAILSYEDGDWAVQFQAGFDIPPRVSASELPSPLNLAAISRETVHLKDLAANHPRQGSGLYTRLTVNGTDVGLLAVEHYQAEAYDQSDAELLDGMSDVLALTLANARSFRRLRSLAAAEERSRIARDLHDRLGQYLTYIALELERINMEHPSTQLKELHEDVQGAITEFRDTLIELRAAVTAERPLATVLVEVVERFRKRSQIHAILNLPQTNERLSGVVENELLRIAQEALVNVEKHSAATAVQITWTVTDGRGDLVIQDNGRGFNPGKGIRGTAYGLVGMRERAASVGATLNIHSEPGQGTVIHVQTS